MWITGVRSSVKSSSARASKADLDLATSGGKKRRHFYPNKIFFYQNIESNRLLIRTFLSNKWLISKDVSTFLRVQQSGEFLFSSGISVQIVECTSKDRVYK